MESLPPFVRAERDALLVEIEAAFDGVSRQGGVSWADAEIADAYGLSSAVERMRGKDVDGRWQDLVPVNPFFPGGGGIGVWPFLDAIGFRYYLPAAMAKSVHSGHDEMICYSLTVTPAAPRCYREDRYTLLSLRQRLCVKRFLEYMDVVDAFGWAKTSWAPSSNWQQALDSDWKHIPEG